MWTNQPYGISSQLPSPVSSWNYVKKSDPVKICPMPNSGLGSRDGFAPTDTSINWKSFLCSCTLHVDRLRSRLTIHRDVSRVSLKRDGWFDCLKKTWGSQHVCESACFWNVFALGEENRPETQQLQSIVQQSEDIFKFLSSRNSYERTLVGPATLRSAARKKFLLVIYRLHPSKHSRVLMRSGSLTAFNTAARAINLVLII